MNNKNMPIYIALGANLSNPKTTFTRVLNDMPDSGISVLSVSGLWQSPAWPPGSDQPDYLNASARVEFSGAADELLAALHRLETRYGRKRSVKNAARPLDLDLLDFRGRVIKSETMEIPHPRMLTRSFVLFPLQQIAPNWRDPVNSDFIWDHIARLPFSDVEALSYAGPL